MNFTSNELIKLHSKHRRPARTMARIHYETLKAFILDTLETSGQISLQRLIDLANEKLLDPFAGEVAWPLLQTKNDLEARGLITITRRKKFDQVIMRKIEVAKTISLVGTEISKPTDLAGTYTPGFF